MNYEDTKRGMLIAYPRLFVNEADVLEHLFLTTGGGYYWDDGELTDGKTSIEEYKEEAKRQIKETQAVNAEYHSPDDTPETLYVKEINYRLDVIEAGIHDCWFLLPDKQIGKILHNISQYANILTVPKDVKPDWLEAAKNIIGLTKTDIFRVKDSDKEQIDKADLRLKYLNLL